MSSVTGSALRRRRIAALALSTGLCVSTWTTAARADAATTTAGHAAQAATARGAAQNPTEQALAKAKASGKPVVVDALTTASSQTTADPDGTFTLDETSMPTRTRTAHGWATLDATLHRNPDGSITPATTASPLVLSGGGNGPLARMSAASRTMAISFPAALPEPALAGATATYSNVFPSVDLVVTADAQGGFSEVLVVKNAAAAANPALSSLTLATSLSPGMSLRTDPAGSITAGVAGGAALFTAPPARMWDSATSATASTKAAPSTAPGRPTRASNVGGPGTGAHQASLKATARQGSIILSPDPAVLKGSDVKYPVFIDPQYTANNGIGSSGWASVPNPIYYTGNYWDNTPDPDAGTMQVGNAGTMWSHTLMNLPVPVGTLSGAHIYSATVGITQIEAYSCTASWVDIYAPGATLTPSNANYSAWPSSALGSAVDRQDVAHGYSGCAAAAVGFNVLSPVTNDINAGKSLQTFALTGENESSDFNSWKEFSESSAHLSIVYEHTPNTPTQASTSPGGACQTGAPSADVIGNDDVTFSVYASTRDTGSPLSTEFIISNYQGSVVYDSATHNANAATGSSGYATLAIPRATIQSWNTNGTTTAYPYSWTAKTSDGTLTSGSFTPCTFTYNPAYPVAPGVQLASGSTATLGQYATITLAQCTGLLATPQTACPSGNPTPVNYVYQLDNGPSAQVTVTGSTQTITLPMTHVGPNTITAYAIAAGGNPSPPISSPTFSVSGPATPYTDGDLTGSGHPDLLYPGTSANPGLWLAASDGTGHLSTPTDIGPIGTGINTTGSPADWAGAQILHGNFTNRGVQDVLAYYPAGSHAGTGHLIYGTGDTSPISPLSGDKLDFRPAALVDNFLGAGNDTPIDLVAAGDASQTTNTTTTPPDLIGINGTATDGYELDLFSAITDSNITTYGQNVGVSSGVLSTTAPDGGAWGTNWTLAAAQPAGNPVLLALNTTTGTLWQSTNPTDSTSAVIGTPGTWTQITTVPWSTGAHNIPTTIAGADTNAAGQIELWTLAAGNASATAYTLAGATLTAEATSSLIGPSHEWPLTDGPGATTAVDTTGNTPATLSASGATWSTDNLFTPDITLDGTNGYLTTSAAAVSPSASFTLDAWVNPTAAGGIALSQDGTTDSDFLLYPNGSQWEFGISNGNTSTWSYDGIVGGSYLLGVWSHLTVTYDATTHAMQMYVNGVLVANGTHTPVSGQPAGAFRIGDDLADGAHSSRFAGQISQVRVWSGAAVPPAQPASQGAYHQALIPSRILDTRTSNVTYSNNPANTPVPAFGTVALQITGDNVTPAVTGAPTTIPATATAVSIDVTAVAPTEPGVITTYPDGTQRPVTSSTNFTANTNITGYQLVPIGLDGKIALYNNSTGTTHLIVDITGYFTTDPSLTGDQTYHPLDPAQRALVTATSIANTTGLSSTGKVPANTTFTLAVTGHTNVPTNATAVSINLTTYSQSGYGYLEAYPTGATIGPLTSLTYQTTDMAQMSADLPIGTGGNISIYNNGSATDVIIDIAGYYTTDTTGDRYRTTAPTRLIDTRDGVGGPTAKIAANTTYSISQTNIDRISTLSNAVPALMLTVTDTTSAGNIVAYGTTNPGNSNVNWTNPNSTVANLALPPLSTAGTVNITPQGSGSIDLVVDCSGYFTNDGPNPPTHAWPLNDGTGTTARDTAGTIPLSLTTTGTTWATDAAHGYVPSLDGSSGYAATSGPVVNTTGSFTVSAWAKLSATTHNAVIAAQDGTNNSGFYLGYGAGNGGEWMFYFLTSDTVGSGWQPDIVIPGATTNWTHLVGVYNATTKTAQLYINGTLAGTATGVTTWNATGPFTIGRDKYYGNNADYFPGDISDAETWNYALSANQVANLS